MEKWVGCQSKGAPLVSFAALLRLVVVVLLCGIVGSAAPPSGLASKGEYSDTYLWRGDKISPAVRDATRSPDFWRVSATVADWRDLDANINPLMSSGRHADIVISEQPDTRWLARSQVYVRDGYVTRARLLLNPALKRAPDTPAVADQILCQELGYVLGLRYAGTDSCMADGDLGAQTTLSAQDEVRLEDLYGTVASSVSNHPGLALAGGECVRVHVFPIPRR